MSSRPALVTYGRSSKKMLARKGSRARSPVEDNQTPATSTKRPRADDDDATNATPTKKIKSVDESPKQKKVVASATARRQDNHDGSPIRIPIPTPNSATPRRGESPRRPARAARTASNNTNVSKQADGLTTRQATAVSTGKNHGNPRSAQLPPTPIAMVVSPPKRSPVTPSKTKSSASKVQADSNNIFFTPAKPDAATLKRKRTESTPVAAPTTPQRRKRAPNDTSHSRAASTERSATPIEEERPAPSAAPKSPLKADALSQLFGTSRAVPSTPAKNGIGVARRMLGRSKTESSLDSAVRSSPSSSVTRSGGSPSLPRVYASLPSVSSQPTPTRPTVPPSPTPLLSPSRREQSQHNTNTRPTVRTYANSRSFLVPLPPGTLPAHIKAEDLPIERDEDSQIQDEIDEELRNESVSYAALKERFDTDEADGIGLVTELRSGSEMKVHGATRRFLDEVGYLLEGLESPLRGVQRTSAIELCEKMCDGDGDFVRKARSADFLSKAWEMFSEMEDAAKDPILLLCIGVFCAIISAEARDIVRLSETTLFSDTMISLLAIRAEQDALRLGKGRLPQDVAKRIGLKRNEVPLMESVNAVVYQRSRLFDESFPVACGKLASTVLVALPEHAVRMTWVEALLPSAEVELNNVMAYLSVHLDDDFMSLEGDSSTLPDVEHLRGCMRVMDSCLLGDNAAHCETLLVPSRRLFASRLVHLCTMCQLLLLNNMNQAIAEDTIDTTLRVLVNLTNESATWSEALLLEPQCMPLLARLVLTSHQGRKTFVTRSDVPDGPDATDPLDKLYLVLGLLTNLVQESSRTAEECLQAEIAWTCTSSRECLRECSCTGRKTAIHLLLRVYTEQFVKTEDQNENAEAHFLLGHLAVLLALMAHQSARALTVIRGEILLRPLLDTCNEWVATYEYGRRRLAATHQSSAQDTQRGLSSVKRAVAALSALT